MNFEKYPFEKLNELLKDITPNSSFEPSVLTIMNQSLKHHNLYKKN